MNIPNLINKILLSISSVQTPRDTTHSQSSKPPKSANVSPSPTSDFEKYRYLLKKLENGLIYSHDIPEENIQEFMDFQTMQRRAQNLCRKYNALKNDDEESKLEILHELLNPSCHDNQPFIQAPIFFQFGYNLTFGKNFVSNGYNVYLDGSAITIGDNCTIGIGSHIHTATHPIDPKERLEMSIFKPVKIGNNVRIGGQSIICPGVTIGDNVVISHGSIVVKDIPSNVHVGGNPARVIPQSNVK